MAIEFIALQVHRARRFSAEPKTCNQYEFEIAFSFEGLALKLDGKLARLFGSAKIIAGQTTWRIGDIKTTVDAPNSPTLDVHEGSAFHRKLCTALDRQFREDIDELANQALEQRGGYMAVYGERIPANPASRGLGQSRPAAVTFQL